MRKILKVFFTWMFALMMCACTSQNANIQWLSGDGNVAGELKTVEIDWVDGSVEVKYGKSKEVSITEKSNFPLEDDQKVHWGMAGTTLKIEYLVDKKVEISNPLEKTLVVEIPKGLNMDSVKIEGASCLVTCLVNAENITIDTAYGDIELDIEKSSKVAINSASGNLLLSMKEFAEVKAATASGNVTAEIPTDYNFTATVETASGKVNDELKMKKDGKTYTNGTGESNIKIDTASGNIDFKAHHETARNLTYK
ncbi:MAG: DUF4097 family beta strand repeat protein [Firmicutes bacterium]|nr:DUF4097 family beta strand repeat protein [Bacillota bacterium]